jgi:Ca-activated chloride channel family protein
VIAFLSSPSLAAPIPTGPTDLQIEVAGPLAELTLRRRFRNEAEVPIDTELWFGLPVGGTLDRFVVKVGDRTITSQVMLRDQAQQTYVQAANEGKVASLVEQQEPDLVVQHIANVLPGDEIEIELHLIAPTARRAGIWELAVPLTVAPRLQDPAGEGPTYEEPGALPDLVEAHLTVQAGRALRWLESPSHAHRTRLGPEQAELWTVGARADRELVLRWSTALPEPAYDLLVADKHGLLLVEPPAPWARLSPAPADVVLLVDASDTMIGPRWQTVLQAAEILMSELEEQDTLTLLVFSDIVRGLAIREPATPEACADALFALGQIPLGGMTNLPLALRAALALPTPPDRARTVVVLSDGGASALPPQDVLARTTLHTVGIGAVTGRTLLADLARRGQGLSVVIGPGDEPESSLAPLIEGLRGPVLTDATVTFLASADLAAHPLPPMYADQLVSVTARGLDCALPARLEGLLAGRPFRQDIYPTCTDQSRLMAVMWALDQVARLPPEPAAQLALEYQILSPYTSLVGVDSEVHNEMGWAASATVALLRPIDTENSSRSTVLSQEHLQRIPAGRTYQSVVQTVPGVTGAAGGHPHMGGSASNENTYLLDGANLDPVTGTFSLSVDVVQRADVLHGAHLPEHPGSGGPVVEAQTHSGTNNLDAGLNVSHGAGQGLPQIDQVSGNLGGPLLRDKIWAWGNYGYGRSSLPGRPYEGHTGFLKLSAQPDVDHRLDLSGMGALAELALPSPSLRRSGLAQARWRWFFAPEQALDTQLMLQRLVAGADERGHEQLQSDLELSVDDPAGGTHELKAGFELDQSEWVGGAWAERWLGVPVSEGQALHLAWFSQDRYQPWPRLTLAVGARVEHALDRTHLGPRLYGSWDPWGDHKTELLAGFARVYGHLGLPTTLIEREQGLSWLDEGKLLLQRELVQDLAMGAEGALRLRRQLPVYGGGRTQQSSITTRLFVHKVPSRRWAADLSWQHTRLLEPAEGVLLDDGLDAFEHAVQGSAWWELPTDPWTTSAGLRGAWMAGPLGTVVGDPLSGALPNLPRWSWGVWLVQDLDVRKGTLSLELELESLALLQDERDLSRWMPADAPLIEPVALEGLRLTGGLRYSF